MAESPYKSKGGIGRIASAWRYSMQGFSHALKHEHAIRQELMLGIPMAVIALFLPLTPVEKLLLIGSIALVIIAELMNSAIEAAVDRIGLEPNELSGRAKDLGSAAVFLALWLCGITWAVVCWRLL
jgi:diacylglycerol kinase (ATP)